MDDAKFASLLKYVLSLKLTFDLCCPHPTPVCAATITDKLIRQISNNIFFIIIKLKVKITSQDHLPVS
jgi:hypothetical protein